MEVGSQINREKMDYQSVVLSIELGCNVGWIADHADTSKGK